MQNFKIYSNGMVLGLNDEGKKILETIREKISKNIELTESEWLFLESHKSVIKFHEIGLCYSEVYEKCFAISLEKTRNAGCTCQFVMHNDGMYVRLPDYNCELHYKPNKYNGKFREYGLIY